MICSTVKFYLAICNNGYNVVPMNVIINAVMNSVIPLAVMVTDYMEEKWPKVVTSMVGPL